MLTEVVRGRQAVHVGFVDELMASKIAAGVWLHARLAGTAASIVGLDVDVHGVDAARAEGYEAYVVDAQSAAAVRALGLERADVVVAPEVIEHLDAPGAFLRAMHELADELVLTTPNAYRLLNFVAPLSGCELVHPDHTAWHSPATLRRLCENSGWNVVRMAYYHNPTHRQVRGDLRGRTGGHLANTGRSLLRRVNGVLPYWGDGIVAWTRSQAASP